MQSLVDELVHQATDTGMIVNGRKTKEILIGPVLKDPPPSVSLSGAPVDRVTVFKLLGVHEVVASRRCYYIEGDTTALSQAAETFGRRAGRLAVFLRHRDPASPGVCLPGVAHKSYCCADEGIRVAAAQSSVYHL